MVKLVLPKSVGFARYRRFGVFVFNGHFDMIAVLFFIIKDDLPPQLQGF
jgi:hypothetical protein